MANTQGAQPSFPLPAELKDILEHCPRYTLAGSVDELIELAVRDLREGYHEVAYEVPGRGRVVEARVCRRRGHRLPSPQRHQRQLPRTVHAAAGPGLHGHRR